jgi:hypothetical protein
MEKKLTTFIKIFSPTTTSFEKLLKKWLEDLKHILQVNISGIITHLSEKVEVRDEFE